MFTSNTFQAEIDYRSNRIRQGVARSSRRHTRVPFVRRPADSTEHGR